MTCVPYDQWLSASAACKQFQNESLSVKGFGYVPMGLAALRGLGDVTMQATFVPMQPGWAPGTSPPPAPPASPTPTPPITPVPTINTGSDPCAIAAQTPCPASGGCPAVCPPGFQSINLLTAPGAPAQCRCGKATTRTMSLTPGPTAPATASAAGGFSSWGLLALLAAAGAGIYLVTRK